jgi:subfamily B ATP-binding cassette protein MsbA
VVRSFGGEDYESARFRAASADNTAKQLRMVADRRQLHAGAAVRHLQCHGRAAGAGVVAARRRLCRRPRCLHHRRRHVAEADPADFEVSATIQKGLAGAESIFAQLDEAPEPDQGTVERERVEGRLQVSDLSFAYPGSERKVLDEVSFSVEPGQMVALVGRSGSGKSTLANLIARFYNHDSGHILIDGVDVEDYTLRNLRRHIALVTQQVVLFNDTVAGNIAYGDLAGAPRAAIEAAAEAAFAREFIDRLDAGLRHADRRERRDVVRRTAAAPGDCPRAAQGCADPDPRRGDFGAGHRVGTPHPERARPRDGGGRRWSSPTACRPSKGPT